MVNLTLPKDLASDGSFNVSDSGLNWKPSIIASGTDGSSNISVC